MRYNADYRAQGLRESAPPALGQPPTGDNPSELFLDVLTTAASQVSSAATGFVPVGLRPTALSRVQGPVAGAVSDLAAGTFKPETFFAGATLPKLFGAFSLVEILHDLQSIARAPKMITDALAKGERVLAAAQAFAAYAGGIEGEITALAQQAGAQAEAQLSALKTAVAEAQDAAETLAETVGDAFDAASLADPAALAGTLATQVGTLEPKLRLVLERLGAPGVVLALPGATRGALDTAARALHGFMARAEEVTATVNGIVRVAQGILDAAALRTRVEWSPTLRNWPAGTPDNEALFSARTQAPDKAALTLTGLFEAQGGGGGPAYQVAASLDRFAVNLPGPVARLSFDRLAFRAVSGRAPEIDVRFGGITFLGPLSFIETIKNVIPLDGFSDPPYVDVSAAGLVAGYTLELPDVAVGAFSLTHIRLGAELNVPFLGETSIGFNIGRREEPVNVIVLFLGGGAFFGITFGMRGLMQIEAAIEAGAAVALNFGVAAGEVHAFVGIYFRLRIEGGTKTVELTAYFRVGGSVKVLGILTVSIELRLEMSYVAEGSNSGKLVGRAELKVKVEVLFFSKTVKIQYERKLAGSNNDPTAYDALATPYPDPFTQTQRTGWDLYLLAFA